MKKVYFMMLLCLLGIISATFNKHKMKVNYIFTKNRTKNLTFLFPPSRWNKVKKSQPRWTTFSRQNRLKSLQVS